MRSRRNRKYRKIEVVDTKVNLINIKTNMTNRKIDRWIEDYDKDMNSVAKGMIISVGLAIIALLISITTVVKGAM